jgi:hypothetical protein
MTIIPNQTLLLSADETYPGLVTDIAEHLIRVVWYKWGFTSPDTFVSWLSPDEARQHILSAAECSRRFGGLPPDYLV